MKDAIYIHIRENIIHNFLTNKKGSIHDLLTECNRAIQDRHPQKKTIGTRILEKHIKKLIEQGYPIERYRPTGEEIRLKYNGAETKDYPHKKKVHLNRVKFYRYSKEIGQSLDLREDEKNKIEEAFIILKRFVGLPGWEWLEYIDEGSESMNVEISLEKKISYEENLSSGSRIHFNQIKDAILNTEILEIERIISLKSKKQNIVFHPCFLKMWKNKWYAFGIGEINDKVLDPYVLPIDKYIKKISYKMKTSFKSSSITNFIGEPLDETYYFKNFIGVTSMNTKQKEIILRFHDEKKFKLLDDKIPHFSWERITDLNVPHIDVRMDLKINNELLNLIYEHATGIEVISPPKLRKQIMIGLEKGLSYYAN